MIRPESQPIRRLESGPRLSRVVVHDGRVYLSGLTADDCTRDVTDQTRQILRKIDGKLRLAGTDKTRVLSAHVWIKDAKDMTALYKAWHAWLPPGEGPACTSIICPMAEEDILAEITVIAAMP